MMRFYRLSGSMLHVAHLMILNFRTNEPNKKIVIIRTYLLLKYESDTKAKLFL